MIPSPEVMLVHATLRACSSLGAAHLFEGLHSSSVAFLFGRMRAVKRRDRDFASVAGEAWLSAPDRRFEDDFTKGAVSWTRYRKSQR